MSRRALYPGTSGGGGQDFACGYDSLWVYSRTDFTGDRICFEGQVINLYMSDYSRFTTINGHAYYAGNWRIPRGSFISGSRPGELWSFSPTANHWTSRAFSPTVAYAGTFQFSDPLDHIALD